MVDNKEDEDAGAAAAEAVSPDPDMEVIPVLHYSVQPSIVKTKDAPFKISSRCLTFLVPLDSFIGCRQWLFAPPL